MVVTLKEPCVYTWHGPKMSDPTERGVYIFGVSTDDNLEITSPNAAGRAQQLAVRQALADNGIPTTAEEYPSSNMGCSYQVQRGRLRHTTPFPADI